MAHNVAFETAGFYKRKSHAVPLPKTDTGRTSLSKQESSETVGTQYGRFGRGNKEIQTALRTVEKLLKKHGMQLASHLPRLERDYLPQAVLSKKKSGHIYGPTGVAGPSLRGIITSRIWRNNVAKRKSRISGIGTIDGITGGSSLKDSLALPKPRQAGAERGRAGSAQRDKLGARVDSMRTKPKRPRRRSHKRKSLRDDSDDTPSGSGTGATPDRILGSRANGINGTHSE